tara:strand:+ start:984 stop:3107 length:2124 start_codon:yes stop_codon:yes gene_type:complete
MKVWAYASLREMLLLFLTLSLFPGQWPFSKKGGAKRKRKAPKSPEYSSPLKGYSDKFKNALHQFSFPTVFVSSDLGEVVLKEWGRLDKEVLRLYLDNVELGYFPNEVVMDKVTTDTTYKDLNDLKVWSREGTGFHGKGIEDVENPGSILDFESWPIDKRLSADLAIWLEYRGFKFRNRQIEECREEIVRAAHFVNDNPTRFKVISDSFSVGCGKYVSFDILLPNEPVRWCNDEDIVQDWIRSLPRVNDEYIDVVFGGRPGVRERAFNWLTSGQVHCESLKMASTNVLDMDTGERIDCYSILCSVTASCGKRSYDVHLFISKGDGKFLGAPVSRCECKAGNFFCAHMLSVLLLLSIIQYKKELKLGDVVSGMPVSILTFQAMPIPISFVYGSRSADSEKSLGRKFSAVVNRGGKNTRNWRKKIKLEEKLCPSGCEGEKEEIGEDKDEDDGEDDEEAEDEGEGEQQDYEDVFKKDVLCTLRVVEAIEERFKCLSKVDSHGENASIVQELSSFNELLKEERNPGSSTDKLRKQLQRHQNLHEAFMRGDLPLSMLSYYLHCFEKWRLDLLNAINEGSFVVLTNFCPTRLSKFPVGWVVLADRGFAYDALKYPNFNIHVTPAFVNKRSQFTYEELQKDLKVCQLRYTSETHFSRCTEVKMLQDIVPWDFFSILQPSNDFCNGRSNLLHLPLQAPENWDEYVAHSTTSASTSS